jgi:hypothetical protein
MSSSYGVTNRMYSVLMLECRGHCPVRFFPYSNLLLVPTQYRYFQKSSFCLPFHKPFICLVTQTIFLNFNDFLSFTGYSCSVAGPDLLGSVPYIRI